LKQWENLLISLVISLTNNRLVSQICYKDIHLSPVDCHASRCSSDIKIDLKSLKTSKNQTLVDSWSYLRISPFWETTRRSPSPSSRGQKSLFSPSKRRFTWN